MEATLDGSPAVWRYSGLIYAVQPGVRPRAILGIRSANTNWASPQTDGTWKKEGALVTLFCDPESKAFVDSFDNPITGKRNAVKPNVLSGGFAIYSANGGSSYLQGLPSASASVPGGFSGGGPDHPIGRVEWLSTGSSISLTTDHAYQVPVQPQLEARTIVADANAFFDPVVKRLKSHFTTTTISPWLGWMAMGDASGHLVWHCSGEKFFRTSDLPRGYRDRAGSLMGLLESHP